MKGSYDSDMLSYNKNKRILLKCNLNTQDPILHYTSTLLHSQEKKKNNIWFKKIVLCCSSLKSFRYLERQTGVSSSHYLLVNLFGSSVPVSHSNKVLAEKMSLNITAREQTNWEQEIMTNTHRQLGSDTGDSTDS